MNTEERLRHFAENLEQYGPDVTYWGDRKFVIVELRKAATEIAAMPDLLTALQETEEALAWLCGALRDQATGHPETMTMWDSTETVRRIEQARAVLKKQSEGATYAAAGLSAMAGMAWRDIAASAYKAYVASTEHSAYRGLPLKEWENLHPAIQTAWEAAARQVGECTSLIGDTPPPDEQSWAGWIPPHMKGE